MRTFSKHSNRHIAVVAESSEFFRKTIALQPSIKFCAAMRSDFFSMFDATSVEMVNAKKFFMQFSTTRALFPIMGKYLSFNQLLTLAVIGKQRFPILVVNFSFHAKNIRSIFLAPFTHSMQTLLPVFPIVFVICDSLSFCIHKNIVSRNIWDGKTIL